MKSSPPQTALLAVFALLLAGLGGGASARAQEMPSRLGNGEARALLEQLQRVGLDLPRSFRVNDLHLRRDAVRLHLQHGTLVFFEPVAGRITGAVFEGDGEALVVPPNREERHQLAKFTGSPILTESFSSAYLRFTDDTFAELTSQIRAGHGRPVHTPEVAERWQEVVATLNPTHAVRILLDLLQSPPVPYFYAGVNGRRLGGFDVVVDERRPEQLLVGQLRWEKEQRFYDVWCSFARRETPTSGPGARVGLYRLNTTINPDRSLEAVAELELEQTLSGQQMLVFHLSRFLEVEEVSQLERTAQGETARPLEFLQDISLSAEEARYRGSDYVLVVLPAAAAPIPAAAADQRTLRLRYRGNIISDAGSGVYSVEARDNWYPSLDQGTPAHFELRFRYPLALELVASGQRREYREEGAWKESTWEMDVPLPVAGFNVGNFESQAFGDEFARVTVYANRQVEPRLARALHPAPEPQASPASPAPRDRQTPPETEPPVLEVERVGRDVEEAVNFFSRSFGPLPYGALQVSPLPGRLAQGYPGLLFLSTLSYLSEADLLRLGLDEQTREQFVLLMPAHETAHQWWGNWLWTVGYRDQWLAEALASYSALLYQEERRGGQALLRRWLDSFRANLLRRDEQGRTAEATGALSLGPRLNSSQSPEGYVSVVYNKGPWVIHMLRELLRDPATGSDALFLSVLRELVAGGERPLNTEEFQRRLEAALPDYADAENTGRLDWFFQQWVHDTSIPRYRLRWSLAGSPSEGWRVEGIVEQSDVSDLFIMPVPVYARVGEEWQRLGSVIVTGQAVAFRFPVSVPPDDVVLDPFQTVLSVPETEGAH